MKEKNINNNAKGRAYYQSLRTKYLNLAKEAATSGDRVLSEYNLQYAEHYGRILSEKFSQPAPLQQNQQSQQMPKQKPQSQQIEKPQTEQNEPVQPEKCNEQPQEKVVVKRKRVVRKNTPPKEETSSE